MLSSPSPASCGRIDHCAVTSDCQGGITCTSWLWVTMNFWEVQSPYKRDTEWHNERFHGSTSIVPQEAPQLTTPPVFSSNDQSSTPHSPSTMLQFMCQRHPRRPCYRQQAARPTSCSRWPFSEFLRMPFHKNLPLPARFWPLTDLLRRPPSRILFFGRLATAPPCRTTSTHSEFQKFSSGDCRTALLDAFEIVWPSGDFCHNLQRFLWRFIFVRSLQSSPDIICYGSVLIAVSV